MPHRLLVPLVALLMTGCITPAPFEIEGQDLTRPQDHERTDHLPAPPGTVAPYGVRASMLAPTAAAGDEADHHAIESIELGLDALYAGQLDEADRRFLAVTENLAVADRWGAHARLLRAEVVWRRWLASPVDGKTVAAWQVSLDQHRRQWHVLETLYAQIAADPQAPRWVRVAARVRAAQAADVVRRQHLLLADCPAWITASDCHRFADNLAETAASAHGRAHEHLAAVATLTARDPSAPELADWADLALTLASDLEDELTLRTAR